MLEEKTTVTDGLRIASSALDVLGTSFTTSSVKHLISPGEVPVQRNGKEKKVDIRY